MTAIYPPPIKDWPEGEWPLTIPLMGARLVACNHCGIVAMDTPAFGWKRYYDEDGELAHHCPAAQEYNTWVAQGLVHLKAPDESIIYENSDYWVAELVGPQDEPASDANDQVAQDHG